jgi:hypothetical protein
MKYKIHDTKGFGGKNMLNDVLRLFAILFESTFFGKS